MDGGRAWIQTLKVKGRDGVVREAITCEDKSTAFGKTFLDLEHAAQLYQGSIYLTPCFSYKPITDQQILHVISNTRPQEWMASPMQCSLGAWTY